MFFSDLGQHKAAVKDYETAADLDPANAMLRECIAGEYMTLTEYDNAIEAYERAIELAEPAPPGAGPTEMCRYNIGIAHKFAGRYEEAIKAFRRCMEIRDCPDHIAKLCIQRIAVCEAVLQKLGRPNPP